MKNRTVIKADAGWVLLTLSEITLSKNETEWDWLSFPIIGWSVCMDDDDDHPHILTPFHTITRRSMDDFMISPSSQIVMESEVRYFTSGDFPFDKFQESEKLKIAIEALGLRNNATIPT